MTAILAALRDYYKLAEGKNSLLYAKHADAIDAAFGHLPAPALATSEEKYQIPEEAMPRSSHLCDLILSDGSELKWAMSAPYERWEWKGLEFTKSDVLLWRYNFDQPI